MVIQLDEKDKQNFIRFIKSVIEGRGNECAQMIYNLSNYQGKKLGVNGFQGYQRQLTKCFSRLNNENYSELKGMVLLWDMMRIIR